MEHSEVMKTPTIDECIPLIGKIVRVKYTMGGAMGHWTGPFKLVSVSNKGIQLMHQDGSERIKHLKFDYEFQGIEAMA
jgi:hypothetical protein